MPKAPINNRLILTLGYIVSLHRQSVLSSSGLQLQALHLAI